MFVTRVRSLAVADQYAICPLFHKPRDRRPGVTSKRTASEAQAAIAGTVSSRYGTANDTGVNVPDPYQRNVTRPAPRARTSRTSRYAKWAANLPPRFAAF